MIEPLSSQSPHANNRLSELNVNKTTKVSLGYSRYVKSMRYILPLVAGALILILMTWPDADDKIVVIEKKELIPEGETEIGENELLNPRYESTDTQNQPVNVTAVRALQNQQNPNLVKLESPNADLKMKDGSNVQIQADDGTYEQETEKLFLQNNVKIHHESGYELQAEELRVDMKTREAFSDKDVRIEGPDAHIEATGLEGNVDSGVLIFKGPAKLTITNKNTLTNSPDTTETIDE